MRYHNITKDDMLNGDGLRVVLWVAGCSHCCKDCQNPMTWDPNGGILFDESAKKEIFDQLDKPYISGITFSGGDPLYHPQEFLALVKQIKEATGQNIWCYTGYTFEQIQNDEMLNPILDYVDVIVDGRFEPDLYSPYLEFRGSSNQRIIRVR